MITITPSEILDYNPTIKKYSGYDRDNGVFDLYISEGAKNLKRLLAGDNVNVDIIEVEQDENMRQLYLSYIVYKFYFQNSYNVENDRPMIKDLEALYNKNYQLLLKSVKEQATNILTSFLG